MEKIFDKLSRKIKERVISLFKRLRTYFKRLLFPLYFFPIRLITYTVYYLIKFIIKLIFAFIGLVIDIILFPFRSLKNLLKSFFAFGIFIYLLASMFVTVDYIRTQYGRYSKFFCGYGSDDKLQSSVVRIVGGNAQGTGFFIDPHSVITNFHVIESEPSPKIIFPDGNFITPEKILGDRNSDLAILTTEKPYFSMVLPLPDSIALKQDEPLMAAGYPMGTDLTGRATIFKGRFKDFRKSSKMPTSYIQTDINLVAGMSGGPLADQCGQVVGINTMGLSGLSLFINADWAKMLVPNFSDQNITKIQVDPSVSPEEAVKAFYTYLKARRMKDGFDLLSGEYLLKTNFEEWTNRFTNILDVNVIKTEKFDDSQDTVFVKFMTENWVNGEMEIHYYEGTWQTIKEDGVYKMLKSKIIEVNEPSWEWFY